MTFILNFLYFCFYSVTPLIYSSSTSSPPSTKNPSFYLMMTHISLGPHARWYMGLFTTPIHYILLISREPSLIRFSTLFASPSPLTWPSTDVAWWIFDYSSSYSWKIIGMEVYKRWRQGRMRNFRRRTNRLKITNFQYSKWHPWIYIKN